MTTLGELVRCDNCGEEWLNTSPPPKEAYEAQRVHVEDMIVLLPEKVVKLYHKEGFSDAHSRLISDRDFCDIQCLFVYVNKYMKGK